MSKGEGNLSNQQQNRPPGAEYEGKAFTFQQIHESVYIVDLLAKITESHAAGIPAEDAAQNMDMMAHAENFPGIIENGVSPVAVQRAYDLFDLDR